MPYQLLEQCRIQLCRIRWLGCDPGLSVGAGTTSAVTEDELICRLQDEIMFCDAPSPAAVETVVEVEETVGYSMPSLLRRIYLEIAHREEVLEWGDHGILSLTRPSFCCGGVHSEPLLAQYLNWLDIPLRQRRHQFEVPKEHTIVVAIDTGSSDDRYRYRPVLAHRSCATSGSPLLQP